MASAPLLEAADPLAAAYALIECGNADEAVALLERLHEERRGGLLLQGARIDALIAANKTAQALPVAREAAALYPNVAAAAVALGKTLLAAGHLPAAIGEFQRALRLDPDLVAARFALGSAWIEAGEADKAHDAFALIPPENAPPALAEKLAEIARMHALARSDARYVRHLFDQFSAEYDARMLEQLHYGAPAILRNLAELVGLSPRRQYDVLDLGCGTGLAGEAFKDIAKRLDGIDLSPAMVERAEARGIYDRLMVGDIETAIAHIGGRYDAILAADTLVYLGELSSLFRNIARALAPQGMFLFSVERSADAKGFELGPKRRWRHSESYLRSAAAAAGLDVAGLLECVPRTEAGKPVEGYAVALICT